MIHGQNIVSKLDRCVVTGRSAPPASKYPGGGISPDPGLRQVFIFSSRNARLSDGCFVSKL